MGKKLRSIPGISAALGICFGSIACEGGPLDPDRRDPPVQLGVLGQGQVAERFTSEVAVSGDWAYTGTWSMRDTIGNALKIWNAAGGTPVLADSIIIAGARTLGDVQISPDGRWLVVPAEARTPADGIYIFDRNDPARPTRISQFVTPVTQGGVHTVKLGRVNQRDYAFLAINPVSSPSTPARLVIVDITTPANPTLVLDRIMGNPYMHDVFVRDGLLFTALWNDGMAIWDLGGAGTGTPANPVQLGNVRTVNGHVHNIAWVHDPDNGSKRYAFVGEEQPLGGLNSSAGDIHVVDVSNLRAPREVAFFHVPGAGTHNFAVDEENGILYAAFYNGGVRALDVRGDLASCAASARASDGRCDLGLMNRERGSALTDRTVMIWGVALQGDVLYASDMLNGLWKIDVSPLR